MCWKSVAHILVFLTVAVSASAASLDGRRDKRQERIETLTMWKMMEALDLDKATADKVFAIRRKYLRERSKLRDAVNEDVESLRYLLRESRQVPGDDDLARLVNRIHENRKKIRDIWEQQYKDVSAVLSVRQQAELVLFLKDFRKELQRMLGRSRMRGRARRGPPSGDQRMHPGEQQGPPGGGMHPPPPPLPPPPPPHPQQPADQPWSDSGSTPDEPMDEP